MDKLPDDPFMLFSFINTKLRDHYASLDILCEDMNIDRAELETKLNLAGFTYFSTFNQFR